jgi:hypothetical protein
VPRSHVISVAALGLAVVVGVVLLQIVDQDAHHGRQRPSTTTTTAGG